MNKLIKNNTVTTMIIVTENTCQYKSTSLSVTPLDNKIIIEDAIYEEITTPKTPMIERLLHQSLLEICDIVKNYSMALLCSAIYAILVAGEFTSLTTTLLIISIVAGFISSVCNYKVLRSKDSG